MFKNLTLGLFALIVGLTTPAFANQVSAQTTDTNCLLPSSSVGIVTCGGNQNATNLSAPDVVITSLNYNQTTHTFTAVVKNQGAVATPANTVIGVGYFVDGVHRTWGNSNTPLAPGASVTIGTSLVGEKAGLYTIASGIHSIEAWVDDVNRFPESREGNNQFTKLVNIGGANTPTPDVVITSLNYNQTTHTFTAVVKNQGAVATPANTVIGVGYFVDNVQRTWGSVPGSLAPGASVTIGTSLNGTAGPYTIANGTHNLRAWVDDVNRFAESNETNNELTKSITVGGSTTVPPVNPPATTPPPVTPPPTVGNKYNPGHYLTLSGNTSEMFDDSPTRNDDGPAFAEKLKDDGVKGVVVRYPWKQLEPTQGNYNYTRVNKHLDLAQAKGLKMVVFVDDKSFNGGATVPDYLKNNSNYVYGNKTGGYSGTRWNPFVKSRFIALWTDMGANLDNHPALEGVVYSETSISMPPGTVTVPAYSASLNKQTIIDTLTAQSAAFPKSNVFWMMNYLSGGQSYIGDIADTVLPLGVIMGGPDILPGDVNGLLTRVYPYYDEFNTKGMRLFGSAQHDSFRHLHNGNTTLPFYTPQQIFSFAKNELHVNYIWWNYKTWTDPGAITREGTIVPPGEYVWDDAVPVIKANPVIN